MEDQTSGLWWLVTILTGAVGAAMAVYGIRQKDPLPLVIGVALSAVPICVNSGGLAGLLSILLVALFIAIRRWR